MHKTVAPSESGKENEEKEKKTKTAVNYQCPKQHILGIFASTTTRLMISIPDFCTQLNEIGFLAAVTADMCIEGRE